MDRGAVLITGASTGIGRATALRLAREGFRVFAGVRRATDGEALKAEVITGIEPVLLDVTDDASIAAAVAHIDAQMGAAGLVGLVNNAGFGIGGPVEFLNIRHWRRVFEVNLFGLLAVTQAALPLLRRAKGRVVLVSSVSGRVATPFLAPYSATKHAVEALGDALRMELGESGIHVSLIEPGRVRTAIWDRAVTENATVRAELPPEADALYGAFLAKMDGVVAKAKAMGIDPDVPAERIQHALTATNPKPRYLVGFDAHVQLLLRTVLPTRWFDGLITYLLKSGWA